MQKEKGEKPKEHEKIWKNNHPFNGNPKKNRRNTEEEVIKIIIEIKALIRSSDEKPQIKRKNKTQR